MSLTASPRRLRPLLSVIAGLAFMIAFSEATNPSSSDARDAKAARLKSKLESRLTFDEGASLLSSNFAWSVAADESNRVHVVWYDNSSGNSQIYYKRSTDGGLNWETEIRLSEDPAFREHPAVAVSGSHVYVVWHDSRNGGLNIFFKRSTDGGATWGPDFQLTGTGADAHASIAASESQIHVVWGDNTTGHAEIYTRRSTDFGATWDGERRLSDLPFDSWVPTVAVSGKDVYAAWVDTRDGNEEEYLKRSTDSGRSWGPDTRMTHNAANSWAPSIAVSGRTVHFVWFDQKDSPAQPLDAERRLDDAMALLGLRVEPPPEGVMVPNPEEAARRGATERLQLIQTAAPAWIERGGDAARLQSIMRELQELAGQGASYLVKERKLDEAIKLMGLTYIPGPREDLPKVYYLDAMRVRVQDKMQQIQAAAPRWVQSGGDAETLESIFREFEIVMNLATTEWEIYYTRSTDSGDTWEPDTRLTNAPGFSQRPSIALSGRRLSVVWFDGRDGNSEIYFKSSRDEGATWSPDARLTDAPGDSMHPSVAASGKWAHVVWFDRRDGNAEIYYNRIKSK